MVGDLTATILLVPSIPTVIFALLAGRDMTEPAASLRASAREDKAGLSPGL